MASVVNIRGASESDLKAIMRAKIEKRMQAALILTQNEMRSALSEHSNIKGAHDSSESAGGLPFKVTGRLAASVAYVFDKANLVGRVGSNLDYSKFLQLGTRKMAARPWMTIAYLRIKDRLEKILTDSRYGPRG